MDVLAEFIAFFMTVGQPATMWSGRVVDLAVERVRKVEGAHSGESAGNHGVRIVGHRNVPDRLAADASALHARNLSNFLSAFRDREAWRAAPFDDDEIVKGLSLTHGGEVVHEGLDG